MIDLNKKLSFLENVDMMVNDTINKINIDSNISKILKTCRSVLQVKFPVKIKDKTEMTFINKALYFTDTVYFCQRNCTMAQQFKWFGQTTDYSRSLKPGSFTSINYQINLIV